MTGLNRSNFAHRPEQMDLRIALSALVSPERTQEQVPSRAAAPRREVIVPKDVPLVVLANREFLRVDQHSHNVAIPPGGFGSALVPIFIEEALSGRPITAVNWDPCTRKFDLPAQAVENLQRTRGLQLGGLAIRAPKLSALDSQQYQDAVLRGFLWPLFHGFGDRARLIDPKQWGLFRQVNDSFAAAAAQAQDPRSIFFIHDYQLMLAAGLLREKRPEATIGYFHHIPFPSMALLRTKTSPAMRQEIAQGILGADLVGFQSARDLENFVRLCKELKFTIAEKSKSSSGQYESAVIEHQGRRIRLIIKPMSVNPERIDQELKSDAAQTEALKLKAEYAGQFIFVAVERLDYTKGIDKHLEAVRHLLRKHPELHGKFVFIQYAAPTDVTSSQCSQLQESVMVNEEYGSTHWNPVVYREAALSHATVLGLFHAADCVVITPIIDGMNLTIKEWAIVADANRADRGVPQFILGEGAGAAEEFERCCGGEAPNIVDGEKPAEIAEAMYRAISSHENPESENESRARLQRLQSHLRCYDARNWYAEFLEEMYAVQIEKAEAAAEQKDGVPSGVQSMSLLRATELGGELAALSPIVWVIDVSGELGEYLAQDLDATQLGRQVQRLVRSTRQDRVVLASSAPFDLIKERFKAFQGYPVIACCAAGGECYDYGRGSFLPEPQGPSTETLQRLRLQLDGFLEGREGLPQGLRMMKGSWGVGVDFEGVLMPDRAGAAHELMNEFMHSSGLPRGLYQVRRRGNACEVVPADCSFDRSLSYILEQLKTQLPLFPVLLASSDAAPEVFAPIDQASGRSILLGTPRRLPHVSESFEAVESLEEVLAGYLKTKDR